VHRHPILRSSIHGDGLPEPLQMVHRVVRLPWAVDDWREMSADDRDALERVLANDRTVPLNLTEPPAMRFALIRLDDARWKVVWTLPALLLDGWSWPLVYRDASRFYEAFCHGREPRVEPARPYRSYLEWLDKHGSGEADEFWRANLAGFREPTPLPGGPVASGADVGGERYLNCSVRLSAAATQSLLTLTRALQVTLNTALQGAWALLLNRQSSSEDVVFGAAFAGRPTDLPGAESIVGPLVNNVPVRIAVKRESSISDFVRKLHTRLLELSSYQFTPLMQVQALSEVLWRDRLFDSVVVFQNYLMGESARLFGGRIDIRDFVGPIHTNYPIMPLVEPGERLRFSLIYDRQRFARQSVERWAGDLTLYWSDAGIPRQDSV
jgi:hypothetical protein